MKNNQWAIIIAILLGFCIFGWWTAKPSKPTIPPAPIKISWRASAISGLVMQAQNTSGNYLSCALAAVNSTEGQRLNYSFSLDPYKQKEIGIMECNWKFMHGEWGHIQVEGYAKKDFTVP